ncbi:MAG: CDP-diacylglycerol--glycerol-3-phosphate 3-phosphatidyltransferase, partial [Myxococcales bacterium]|nr:CDP-diacylglycerol--glycerol-3-phosphate 3-phosphatidyltransferase [Myxococcales bacterium]
MRFSDLHLALGGFGALLAVVIVYLVRAFLKGRARHSRTDLDGGSVFLSKAVMEIGYWLAEPLVGGLVALRITPAMITVFSLVPALLAGVAVALGWFALAGLLGALASLCDVLDGLVARRTGVASDAGEALDAAVDRYSEFLFLAGVAVYYRTNVKCLLLTLAAMFGGFMVSYTTAKAEAMNVAPPRGTMRRPERAVYLFMAAALTAVTKALWGDSISLVLREFPIIFVLALVATVTNASTVTRFRAIIEALHARRPA